MNTESGMDYFLDLLVLQTAVIAIRNH